MTKYFYADCVLNDVRRTGEQEGLHTAMIDGQRIDRLLIDPVFSNYLNGVGKNTKNRVWFFSRGLKKKTLGILAMETAAGERQTLPRLTFFQRIFMVTAFPIAIGMFASMATMLVLLLPFAIIFSSYSGNGDEFGAFWLSTWAFFAIWQAGKTINKEIKLSNLDGWKSGDIASYANEVAPLSAFGLPVNRVKKAKEDPTGW